MAIDATGTPTSPDSIPKYNPAVDAPSGLGFNAAMDAIQAALATRPGAPTGIVSGECMVWNGSTFVRSSVTKLGISNLAGYPSDSTRFLRGDGAWISPGAASAALDISTTSAGPSNTAARTVLYSYAIPGGTVGSNGEITIDIYGDWKNNSGAARAPSAVDVKWGGTIFCSETFPSMNPSANRQPFHIRVSLRGQGTTSSQRISAELLYVNSVSGAPTTGIGNLQQSSGAIFGELASNPASEPAIDSTSAQTIEIAMTLDIANASYDFTKRYAVTRKTA